MFKAIITNGMYYYLNIYILKLISTSGYDTNRHTDISNIIELITTPRELGSSWEKQVWLAVQFYKKFLIN